MKKLLICVLTCFSLVGCNNNSNKSSSLTNGLELLKKGFTIQGTFTSDKEYYQNSGYDIPTGDSEQFSYYIDATYQNDENYMGVDRRYYKVDENGNKSYSHGENAYSNDGYLYYNYLDYDNVVKNDACSYVDYYNVAPYASSGYANPFTLMDATDFEETGDNKYAINNLKGTIFYNYLFGTLENNTPYIQVDTTSFVFNDNDELTTIDFVTKPFYSSETYGDEYQVIYTKTVFTAKLTVSNVGNANAKDLMKAEEEKPENDVLGTALNNLKNAQSLTIDRHLIPYVDGELQPQEECVTLYYDGSHIYNQVWEYNTENGEIPQKASASDTYLEADKTGLMEVYTLNDDGETFSKDSLKGNYFPSINRLYSYGEFLPGVFSIAVNKNVFDLKEENVFIPTQDNIPYVAVDLFVPFLSSVTYIVNGYTTSVEIFLTEDQQNIDRIEVGYSFYAYSGKVIYSFFDLNNTSIPFTIEKV